MKGSGSLLLTEAGEKAILKFLDENTGIFESLTDRNLLGNLHRIANERENHKGLKDLKIFQIQGRLARLAKNSYHVSPADLVFLGPTACKKGGAASKKNRKDFESETSATTTPALSLSPEAHDEPQIKAIENISENAHSFTTDTEPVDDVSTNIDDQNKPPKSSSDLTKEVPFLLQERHLIKVFEDNWGPTYAPRLQDVQDEMHQIFEECGAAVGLFIQDMNVQQLNLSHLTDPCNDICNILVGPLKAVNMQHALFTIYYQNSLNPILFLRAIAGAALFSWVLESHLRRDSSFKEMVATEIISAFPEDTHDTENPMSNLLQILEELVVPTERLIEHLATKHTNQLLKVLTAFRDPVLRQQHPRADPEFEFLAGYDRAMTAVFERACRLRIMLSRSSPSTYRFTYARSRDRFDRNWMTRIPRDGGIVVENDLVTICLSPAIYGSAGEGEAMRVLCRAMVI